jgi:hypothetical protein
LGNIPSQSQKRELSPGLVASQNISSKAGEKRYSKYGDGSRTPKNKKRKSYRKKSPVGGKKVNKYRKSSKSNGMSTFLQNLANVIEEERSLEENRRLLIALPDFYMDELFNMVDRRGRGKFTFDEFRYFLNQIGVLHTDTRSLIDLYSAFDSN